jgi:hypothetical protein
MPSRAVRTTAFALTTATLAIAAAPAGAAELETWQRAAHTGSLARSPKPAGDAPIICVVDTGVDLVPSVANNVIGRYQLIGDPTALGDGSYVAANPASGHGTYVSQVALATWPWARIISVRIGDATGALAPLYRQGINACRNNGANVINLSIGAKSAPSDSEKEALARASGLAADDNIDVVAAAGNNPGPTNWPAAGLTSTGVAVGAFDDHSRWCDWASRGPEVIIGASACSMPMAATHDPVRMVMSGSSFAAPQVAAVMAALQAYRPELTAAQRRELVRGLPSGMLNGDEILRRAELPHLITEDPPLPVPQAPTIPQVPAAPEGPTGTGTPVPDPGVPAPAADKDDDYFTNADEIDDTPKPRLKLSWKGKRLLVRSINAPSRSRLVVRVGSRKKALQARSTRLYVPAKLSKAKVRVVVRLVNRSGRTVLARTFKAPRHR